MKKFAIILFISALLAASCKKDENQMPIYPVDIYVDVNNALYNDINAIGGYMYLTGGYKGIIVYRAEYEKFVAIERACPYHPSDDCGRLVVEDSGLTLVDSVCGSRFLIYDGSIVNGPSSKPAMTYTTYFDGNYIHIFN